MADNKNIIIGLLIVAIIILAFLAMRPMMYSSTYNPGGYQSGQMGPGMMNNPGYNYSYGSGMMGDGSGMMGNMMTSNMMGNMMALYYPESKPITQDEALRNMQNFSTIRLEYGSRGFHDIQRQLLCRLKDTNSNQYIAELLVDRYSGSAYAEPGPNMMWNTQLGTGRAKAEVDYDVAGAEKLAGDFLTGYLPGAQIRESKRCLVMTPSTLDDKKSRAC